MTKKELETMVLEVVEELRGDEEGMHMALDNLLIEFINSEIIEKIYEEETLWYA